MEHRTPVPNDQLSIYGAVTNWCEQFGLKEEEKDEKS